MTCALLLTNAAIAQESEPDAAPIATTTQADGLPPDALAIGPAEELWELEFTPYLWVPAVVDGDSTVGGTTVDLDLSFSDIIDNFDVFGVSGLIEIDHKRSPFSFFAAISYLDLDSKQLTVSPPGPAPISAEVGIDIEQTQVDFGLKYRLFEWAHGRDAEGDGPRSELDIFLGGRYMSVKQQISGVVGPATVNVGGTEHFWDLTIGVGLETKFNDQWSLLVGGAGGGFGISDGSTDLTGSLVFGAGYRPKPNLQFRFEYQFYWIDLETTRDDGPFGLDALMHGPWLGASWTF